MPFAARNHRKPVAPADLGEQLGGGSLQSLLGIEVDSHEAVSLAVAEIPFEVVEQRPVQITANVDSLIDSCRQGDEVIDEESQPLLLVASGDSVLGNQQRDPEGGVSAEHGGETRGIDLEPAVAQRAKVEVMLASTVLAEQGLRAAAGGVSPSRQLSPLSQVAPRGARLV